MEEGDREVEETCKQTIQREYEELCIATIKECKRKIETQNVDAETVELLAAANKMVSQIFIFGR